MPIDPEDGTSGYKKIDDLRPAEIRGQKTYQYVEVLVLVLAFVFLMVGHPIIAAVFGVLFVALTLLPSRRVV